MIAKDNMPLQTTEKEGFKTFLNSVVPLYNPPSRNTIVTAMENKYEILYAFFKDKLKSVEHVTLTTDIWTETTNTRSFIGK